MSEEWTPPADVAQVGVDTLRMSARAYVAKATGGLRRYMVTENGTGLPLCLIVAPGRDTHNESIDISEFENSLRRYLTSAATGASRVLVTIDGTPACLITPLTTDVARPVDEE